MIKSYKKRPYYLDKIKPFVGKDLIKVIVGQRRVGKSYFLFQIIDFLKRESGFSESQIIQINKELPEFRHIKTDEDLLNYVEEKSKKNVKYALFIDEIQEIENFEKAIRSLNAEGNYDIYCTGSNAHMLSGELGTLLSGRYIEIEIYTLSYLEFCDFHELENNPLTLKKYFKYGGLPYLSNLSLDDYSVFEYLRNIYQTILYKDVMSRHQIRNTQFLEKLIEYLASNVGSLVSAKRISDFCKSQNTKISSSVVTDYLSFLKEAFFVFEAPRAEVNGKKIFEINHKYYFGDIGFRHFLTPYIADDIGKILENVIFLHLKMCGFSVMVGQMQNREIDFVCERGTEKMYLQVAYVIPDEKVVEREFGNLLKIRDNYPKMVISMDEICRDGYEGIRHLHVRDFLSTRW